MPIHLLPSLLLSLFAVGYTPGPANIYALGCVLANGRKQALKAWLGLLSGAATASFLAACATHFASLAIGDYMVYVKYLGVAYIAYLAWKTLRAGISDGKQVPCSYWNGFMVQLTNAKMILFDLTVFTTFVLPYSNRFVSLLPVATLLLIAGPGANLVWLLAGSVLRPFALRHQKVVNIVMAIALLGCAVYITVC